MTGPSSSTRSLSNTLIQGILHGEIPNEGQLLQRGGEQLPVQKIPDRFAVGFADRDDLTTQAQAMGQATETVVAKPILAGRLTEIQVPSDRLIPAMEFVRSSSTVAFASHIYQLVDHQSENAPTIIFYITDEITLQFAQQVTQEDIEAIATMAGITPLHAVEGVPNARVFRLTNQASVNPLKLTNRLIEMDGVLVAEPNVAIAAQSFYQPQDPYYPKQWYLQHDGGNDLVPGSHINVEAAWDVTRGDRSVVVAVIDDAFDLNHPDVRGMGKLVAPKDFNDEDSIPPPVQRVENHGTAVAGLAIAEENGNGIVGVAPGCALMPIRYPGFFDDGVIEDLFSWAIENGASVIANSWGPVAVYFPLSLRQRAAINRAATVGRQGKGCVVVFASGNGNRPVNGTVNERGWTHNVVQGRTQWLNGFAVHPDVITVAACTSLGKKSLYSNWGSEIVVAAPSNNAVPGIALPQGYTETGPTVTGNLRGRAVMTSDRLGTVGYTSDTIVETFGGTSSACPIVAGVAALMLSANPDLTAQEVRQILQATADKIIDPDADLQLGLRRGTYDVTGHSEWFGYGKVNAARAVQEARRRVKTVLPVTQWVQHQVTESVSIPDQDFQGGVSAIAIDNTKRLRDIRVDVELRHPFLGDLEVHLRHPQGDVIRLQSRTLGNRSHLQATYTLETTPLLQTWLNQPIQGTWQLIAIDHVLGDTGEIVQWTLSLGI